MTLFHTPGGRGSRLFRRLTASTAAIAGALLVGGSTAGSAWAGDLDVGDAASAYERAVAESGSEPRVVIEPLDSGDGPVQTPSDPAAGVTIGSGADAVQVVPDSGAASFAKIPLDGARSLYRGADGRTSTVVEPVGTGVRLAVVTNDDSSDAQTFRYRLGLPNAASAHVIENGAVEIVRADGTVLVTVAPPWAKDAEGKNLLTSYTLDGSTLVQTVQTRGAAFPVVADPRVERTGLLGVGGVKVWFTRRETSSLKRAQVQINTGVGLAGLACGLIPPPINFVCGALVIYTLGDFNQNVTEAHRRNHCLTLEFRLVGGRARVADWDDGDGRYCVHP